MFERIVMYIKKGYKGWTVLTNISILIILKPSLGFSECCWRAIKLNWLVWFPVIVADEQPFIKLLIPNANNLPSSSFTMRGEPDSPDVGQNWRFFSVAQIVPGG